jgi:hypothetical protein
MAEDSTDIEIAERDIEVSQSRRFTTIGIEAKGVD